MELIHNPLHFLTLYKNQIKYNCDSFQSFQQNYSIMYMNFHYYTFKQ